MLKGLFLQSQIFLAGICVFAAIQHFTIGKGRSQHRVHLLFAVISLLMALYTISNIQSYMQTTLVDYITALRITFVFYALFVGLFPRFIAEYSGVRPTPVLAGLSSLMALPFILNLTQPYTILYSEIHEFKHVTLPGGTEISTAVGTYDTWYYLWIAAVYSAYIFGIYALTSRFRRDRRRTTLVMIFAVGLLLALSHAGTLFRMGIIHIPPLVPFGFLAMVIVMGLTLNYERQQDRKIAEKAQRESDERLSFVMESSHIGVWDIDLADRSAFRSLEHDIVFGYKALLPLWTYEIFLEHVLPEDRMMVDREFQQAVKTHSDWKFECRIRRTDGEMRWISVVGRIKSDDTGILPHMVGAVQDITGHKQAEEDALQGERKYRNVLNASYDAVMLFDAETGKVIEVNKVAEALYGYGTEEFLNLHMMDLTAEPDYSAISVRQAIDAERVYDPLRMHRKKDGTPFPVEISASSFMYKGRRLICGCVRDITERLNAETELRESEHKYRDLFNNAEVGIFRTRLDGSEVLAVNRKFLDIVGMTMDETLGKPSVNLWAVPIEREEMVKRLVADGSVLAFEYKMINKRQGEVRNCLTSVRLYPEQGILEGSILDITERKRAEEGLLRSKNLLNATGQMAKIGGWEYDILSDTLTWTDEIYHIHEVTADFQPTVRAALDFYTPESRDVITKAVERAIEFGEPYDLELTIKTALGREVSVRTVVDVHKKDGTPIKLFGIFQDITERKKLGEQLRQSQKMEAIGTLAGGVAHDFNNILTAIVGFGTILKKRVKDDEKLSEYIGEVLAGAQRAAELTHRLLAFSRKQTIALKLVDLNDIVRNVNMMLVRVIGEDIKLTNLLINRELAVMADCGQIEQVLLNLATNARDAMPDGGELTIQTGMVNVDNNYSEAYLFEKTGMYAVLMVSDTGIGMDQEVMKNIFEPFFTTKEVGKGTGLGLAMVYGIAKQHGGNIDVDSKPGKGTTFKMYLPMITNTIETAAEADQPVPLGRSETLLLAEDDPQVRKITRIYLQENGYEVIEAENGEEAVTRFIENRDAISLILLDVIMPVKNGRETYEDIQKLKPGIKAIFMSGYTDDIISKKGILSESFYFISKPINPDTLMTKLREVLDK